MMRVLLIIILLIVAYQAAKTVFRSARDAYHRGEPRPPRVPGEEMVLDPQCRTYVVKDRAVSRRAEGATRYFCSDSCADAYARRRG